MPPTSTVKQDGDEPTVLLVGTPPVDVAETCDRSGFQSVDIDIVADGRAAIKRLTAASQPSADAVYPDLVLLQCDFELPDGMTVLHTIKSSPHLNALPVVMLDPDGNGAGTSYQASANAYVETPETVAEYTSLFDAIATFWFRWVEFPGECLYSNR